MHDLHIYRPIAAGDKLVTQATMVDVKAIKPGAAYTMRLDTHDASSGELVCRTYQLGIYRGVEISGPPTSSEAVPKSPSLAATGAATPHEIRLDGGLAHTYTECARIWNPIHTDRAVALRAGLPDIILHGTATLALAVSKIVDQCLDRNSSRITRLGSRFAAMVLVPSTIVLEVTNAGGGPFGFQVLTTDGQTAINGGFMLYTSG